MEIVGYDSNPLTYGGEFLDAKVSQGFSDLIPDCIIRRKSGVAMRPALATKYSAGMETATPTDIHFANAFSSPILYHNKVNFNTCTILPVTTGAASHELGKAVYYNYPQSSTDYIYFHLNSSGEYDLTNAGAASGRPYTITNPGESEVVRLKYLGRSTGPSFNLSDFTAVRNVYMPNLTDGDGRGGIHGIFQFSGDVEDGDVYNAGVIHVNYSEPQVRELENFYLPFFGSGGYDDWGAGWRNISSVKNVQFGSYNPAGDGVGYDHFPNLKYMENLSASVRIGWDAPVSGLTVRGNNLSSDIFVSNGDILANVSASVAATASIIDGNIRFNYGAARDPSHIIYRECQIGLREPTTITLHGSTDYGAVRSARGLDAVVPSGTYDWSVASGFYMYNQVFSGCTAGNVSVIVE